MSDDFSSKEEALKVFIETAKQYFTEVKKVCRRHEALTKNQSGFRNSDWVEVASNVLFVLKTPQQLASDYVKHILPHKEEIYLRNEKFFLENDHIYPGVDSSKVQFLKDLWINRDGCGFRKNEKEISFEFFDVMVDAVDAWNRLSR